MLATLFTTKISEWNIQKCCYCTSLPNGVMVSYFIILFVVIFMKYSTGFSLSFQIIGFVHTVEFILMLGFHLFWINDSQYSKSCFGPIKVDVIDENCTELLIYQKLPRTHEFQTFQEELLRLSAFFQVFFTPGNHTYTLYNNIVA